MTEGSGRLKRVVRMVSLYFVVVRDVSERVCGDLTGSPNMLAVATGELGISLPALCNMSAVEDKLEDDKEDLFASPKWLNGRGESGCEEASGVSIDFAVWTGGSTAIEVATGFEIFEGPVSAVSSLAGGEEAAACVLNVNIGYEPGSFR